MGYELWDIDSRNFISDFDTLHQALHYARELIASYPERYPEKLALGHVEDHGAKFTWLAHGADIFALLEQRPAV